jgi:hypothetical protein
MTISLLILVLSKAALLSALGWLAWAHERDAGWDAFHLVPLVAAATLVVGRLDSVPMHDALRALIPFVVAAVCMTVNVAFSRMRSANDDTLLVTILVATVSLVIFDAMSAYTPQTASSLPPAGIIAVGAAVLLAISVTWLLNRETRLLALGEANRWAVRYWRGESGRARFTGIAVATYLSWVAAIAIPLQTTGALSATVFKNVVFGVLLARVASIRGVPAVLATALTLALVVTATGFFIANRYTPMVIEFATLATLFTWAQRRSERSLWLNDNVR